MQVETSNHLEDIVEVNRRSAGAKHGVRIMELSSLSDLIPRPIAEEIRADLLRHKVPVRQLTNQGKFDPWTSVEGFVQQCMTVRHLAAAILPIAVEVLIFDDTVALYRTEPEVSMTVIQDADFAAQQGAMFDALWDQATPLPLNTDGSTNSS